MNRPLPPPPGPPTPKQAGPGGQPKPSSLGYHYPPPHSIEAEQAVLGGLLIDEMAWNRVADILSAEDFYRHDHWVIFDAIEQVAERGTPPDTVTVGEVLERQGLLEEVGGYAYLLNVANTTPTSANITHYAQAVREGARKRRAMELAEDLRTKAAAATEDEFPRILERTRETIEGLEKASSPALVDTASVSVGDMLEEQPPPRQWLLQDLLPLGVVGLLAAGGGTGKSFLTLQLGIAVATGRPFLGIEVGEPGGALVLAAEDEREEVHRRLWRIVESLQADGELEEADLELVKERLFIVSRVGEDNRLIQNLDGRILPTGTGKQIAALVEELPPINLVVLDPVSRFRDGDENDNASATRFVEEVERLRSATGATVLLCHHVSKNGLRAGTEGLSADALRGASALVDGVRWAAAMATLGKEAANTYGVDPEDAGKYVRLDAVENNYAAPWEGLWLARGPGGVLAPTELRKATQDRQEQKAEERYHQILPDLRGLIRQHQEKGDPLTKNRIKEFAGKEGMFGVGDQALRGIVSRAIAEGHLREEPVNGRTKVLKVGGSQ